MKLRPVSSHAGVSAIPAFLAIGVVAVIVILAVMVAALSSPESTPSIITPPDNDTGPAPGINVNNTTEVTPTPTPEPPRFRIVVGEDADPTPEPTANPNGGMYFNEDADKTARHIAYAFQPNVSGIADFTASWIVPQRPKYNGGPKHTIFLWTGIQQGSSGLIQAVLEWDHDNTGKYWTLACWAVNARDRSYEVSPRIQVYPGDIIKAEMHYETDPLYPWRKVWRIIMTDETHETSTELLDRDAVVTNRDVIVFSGVLEGVGPVADGDDLPGDVMFRDIIYKDEYGIDMSIYLIGYVNPDFRRVAVEYNDRPAGSPVIIRTDYSLS